MRPNTFTQRSTRSLPPVNRASIGSTATSTKRRGTERLNFEAAAAYAERHGLEALLCMRGGEALFERYADGFGPQTPHALYSGTKSFWGPVALSAQREGLFDLDETVGATFPQWDAGFRKGVTLRMLLQLTSGIGFGGLGNAVPTYDRALDVELKNEPGTTFTYGGIPLQVFGAVLAAKLASLTPHAYLTTRILEPAGVTIAKWRDLRDGTKPLPTGAFVSAHEWAKYGRAILEGSYGELFVGSSPNPHYGLGWWLDTSQPGEPIPYASGSGGQALYLIPRENAVVVKFGRSASYRHEPFLKRLLS